ncbi:uncharacterized protein LOC123259921 isoform X1 [Cotesia glomerata]|uniref:uncharacterized protein LOC123259921 isoform X1 n=1 Tax=Cotesia glomerata TaxID=32391 RepID=UPI001D00335C|nr:uncharacterized protein LOC123259921 isoform X1 [Cotesia glomerata]
MILKGLLTLLTIFHLQNGVTSNSHEVLFEITDINSIKKFIDEHYDVSRSEKSFSVLKNLTLDEKKKAAREFYLEMEALIKNISEMIPEYERFYNSWWYEVPRDLKPYGVGRRDNFDLFAMKGRLEVLYKIIEHDVDQFFSDYMTRSQGTGNDANEINDCMHSWALYWYSANENSLNLKLNLHHGPLLVSGSIRQLFYDLTFYLSRVKKAEDNKYNYCKRTSSYHQEFYQMYKQLVIKIFQEFSVRYFSSMGQAICVSQSHMETLERMKRNLFNDLKAIMKSTKGVLHNTTWYMYQCDPTKFDKRAEEVTHLELEKMVQTVIIAEKDLSTTHSCSHNCNLNLIKDTLNKTQCDEFLDCQYSTPGYQITELRNSSRRYKFFTGYDGEYKKQYGDPHRHSNNRKRPSDVSSSYNWGTMRFCDYCICTCAIKPSRSPHVITAVSFREQVSEIENNKVVAGLKFVKKDGMIHIQIAEREVLPHGHVGYYELWKPLEEFTYNETTEKYYVLKNNESQIPLEFGVDYARPHEMNLNNVMAPKKHAITGVRWRFAGDSLEFPKRKQGPIELQVRVTSLDFSRGKLINLDQSSWITPKEQSLKDELILENPDNPIYASQSTGWRLENRKDPQYGQLKIQSTITSNKFVKFRASDLKKDAGQSTVPFFDGRESGMHESLLGGVGLIHRGVPGSGGHLAFKIFDFDMSPYFNIIDDTSKTLLN